MHGLLQAYCRCQTRCCFGSVQLLRVAVLCRGLPSMLKQGAHSLLLVQELQGLAAALLALAGLLGALLWQQARAAKQLRLDFEQLQASVVARETAHNQVLLLLASQTHGRCCATVLSPAVEGKQGGQEGAHCTFAGQAQGECSDAALNPGCLQRHHTSQLAFAFLALTSASLSFVQVVRTETGYNEDLVRTKDSALAKAQRERETSCCSVNHALPTDLPPSPLQA